MTNEREMICIICPLGCRMTLTGASEKEPVVTGHSCPRGARYAVREVKHPERILPTTVVIEHAMLNRLPVRTSLPVPRHMILPCMEIIRNLGVSAPVAMGDIILHDILGTGADLIASRSMPLYNDIQGVCPTANARVH